MKSKLLITFILFAIINIKIHAQTWSALGPGMNDAVLSLAVYNGELYAGGQFSTAGGDPASCVAGWDGSAWHSLGTGLGGSFPHAWAMYAYNGELYVSGENITSAGGTPVNNIAGWDGTTWNSVGAEPNSYVLSLNVYNGNLVMGGDFTSIGLNPYNYIANWNGTAWSSLGTGVNSDVYCTLTNFESPNTYLYACGLFSLAGSTSANKVAKWDGTSWTNMGLGAEFQTGVYAMAYYNNELYVGGHFNIAQGSVANRIAKWNGTAWVSIGTGAGMDGRVTSLAVYKGALYAGGLFSMADTAHANGIAKWDGVSWSAVGGGIDGSVEELLVFNNDLYVCGEFSTADGITVNHIAKWHEPTAGIKNEIKASDFLIYPNPCHSAAVISTTTELKNADLVIYDMLGQIIKRTSNISGKQITFDRDNLPAGVYVIQVEQDKKTSLTGKLVITD